MRIEWACDLSVKISPDDATLKALQWHSVLFENSHIRILGVAVNSGQRVSFHLHQWNHLMVVVQGSKFEIESFEGALAAVEIEDKSN